MLAERTLEVPFCEQINDEMDLVCEQAGDEITPILLGGGSFLTRGSKGHCMKERIKKRLTGLLFLQQSGYRRSQCASVPQLNVGLSLD